MVVNFYVRLKYTPFFLWVKEKETPDPDLNKLDELWILHESYTPENLKKLRLCKTRQLRSL